MDRILALCLLLPLLTACGGGSPDAPGGEVDPERIVVLFQRQRDPEATRENARLAAEFLSERLGMPVSAVVPGNYAASVQALVAGQVDVAYLSALPFLLARRDAGARLILAEVREDREGRRRTTYDSVLVARADSDLGDFDAIAARAGRLRICFTSPTSTSGFVMPMRRFVQAGLATPGQDPKQVFGSVAYGGGYSGALREVLLGRADLAAVSAYTVEGPHTDLYVTAEELANLRVVDRTPEVPTHLVAVRGGLSEALEARIAEALLALAAERPDLLANVYGAMEFRRVDEDEHLRPAIEAVAATGLPIEGLAR
jgi:phosphonate transport system substrate-binding protein